MVKKTDTLFYGKRWHENLFLYLLYASWIIYAVALLGFTIIAPKYLSTLKNILKIYVSLFLIIRFNVYNKGSDIMSRFDKRIAFSSGIFLLLTTTITDFVEKYISEIKHFIKSYI